MILIMVSYRAKAGERDAFVRALLDEQIPNRTREEEGNIGYDFLLPIEDPDVVCLVERWRDEACLNTHVKQPMFLRLSALRGELGVERERVSIYNAQPKET